MKNTNTNIIQENITEQVLEKLKPMLDISIVEKYLFKDTKKFGMIKDGIVYLIDKSGDFKEVTKNVLDDNDKFLMLATKAYWIASGKI